MNRILGCALVLGLSAAPAWATDWVVDASGQLGSFTNLVQAMAAALPGDRILVYPGSYPAFQFSKGVDVVGMGTDPGQVVIERVDYHVTVPMLNYKSSLSNLTVTGAGTLHEIPIGGNELGGGVLVIDGVRFEGSAFLHGGGQFYLLVNNSRITQDAGDGFMNSAFDFSGGVADFVNTSIRAARGAPHLGAPAGLALRVGGGATVRISGCEILGGQGSEDGDAIYMQGGNAIEKGIGSLPVVLRISGGSVVHGGDASSAASGGVGVSVNGSVLVGRARVSGGFGAGTNAASYALSGPTALGYDPQLVLDPGLAFAQGDVFFAPGDSGTLFPGGLQAPAVLCVGTVLAPPHTADVSPFVREHTLALPEDHLEFSLPKASSSSSAFVAARRHYFQAFFTDPVSGLVVTTNPVVLTLAH